MRAALIAVALAGLLAATPVAQPAPPSPAPFAATGGQSIAVPLNSGAWVRAPQYAGGLSANQNGLLLQGGAWTNGRLQNGVYDGNRAYSAQAFDFSGGGDAYLKLLVDAGGQYMAFWPRVLEGVTVRYMTTHHSWNDSVVAPEKTWLFAHVRVQPGGAYTLKVATGGYDDAGGRVIYGDSGRLGQPSNRFDVRFGDNYAGQRSSVLVGEASVAIGRSAAGPLAHLPPPPKPSASGPGSIGGSCASPNECGSGVCLLGVCTPRPGR